MVPADSLSVRFLAFPRLSCLMTSSFLWASVSCVSFQTVSWWSFPFIHLSQLRLHSLWLWLLLLQLNCVFFLQPLDLIHGDFFSMFSSASLCHFLKCILISSADTTFIRSSLVQAFSSLISDDNSLHLLELHLVWMPSSLGALTRLFFRFNFIFRIWLWLTFCSTNFSPTLPPLHSVIRFDPDLFHCFDFILLTVLTCISLTSISCYIGPASQPESQII